MNEGETVELRYATDREDKEKVTFVQVGKIHHAAFGRVVVSIPSSHGEYTLGMPSGWLTSMGGSLWTVTLQTIGEIPEAGWI
jgi:hypothetical protein